MNARPLLNSFRSFRTLVLWLGLAALMVQAIAPLCLSGLMGAGGRDGSSIVICTAHGYQTIHIGTGGNPLPPAQDGSACLMCLMCQTASTFTTPPPIFIAAAPGYAAERALVVQITPPAARPYLSYITRGPPAAEHEFA